MKRGYLVGLAVAAGVTGAAVLGRERIGSALGLGAGEAAEPQAQQWPFDGGELRGLMDRVVDNQRAIVAGAESPDQRERAEGFLKYYEGRRAAVSGS